VTNEASTFLLQRVDFYESDADEQQFAQQRLASEKLVNTFMGALSKKNHPKFRHDPRLDAVAHLYARAFGHKGSVPSRNLIQWAMWKMGVPGRISDTDILWVINYNPHEVLSVRLRTYAMGFEAKGDKYKFGLSRVETSPGKWAQAAIVVEDMVTVHDLPKKVQPGGKWVLRGKINSKHSGATLSIQLPQNNRVHLRLKANERGQFLVELPMIEQPGRYLVEMSVDRNPGYDDTAFLLPIYVGVDEPAEPEPHIVHPGANPSSLEGWPAVIMAAYNESRADVGIAPLQQDDKLTAYAQAEAERFAKAIYKPWSPLGLFMHRQGATLANSIRYFSLTDNAKDMAYSALNSVHYGGLLLDRKMTMCGLGVAPLKDDKSGRVVVVQVIAEPDTPPLEPTTALTHFPAPASKYSSDKTTGAVEPWADQAEALARELAATVKSKVSYDPALSPLAEYVARRGRVEDYMGLWMLSWAGRYGQVKLAVSRDASVEQSNEWFKLQATHAIKNDGEGGQKQYLLGLFPMKGAGGRAVVGTVLIEQAIELETFPKRVRAGQPISFSGRLLSEPQSPRLYLDRLGSEILSRDLPVDSNGRFNIEVPAPAEPGLHLLEVAQRPMGVDEDDFVVYTWNDPVLLLPIYVDAEEPVRLSELPVKWRRPGPDPAAWPDQILERYNEERTRLGLKRLNRIPIMDAFIATRLYREQYTYDVPSLFRVAQQACDEGLAVPVSGGPLVALDWPMRIDFARLIPSQRLSWFSPDITAMAFAVNSDGSQIERVVLAPNVPSKLVVKNKAAAFQKLDMLDDRLFVGNRFALEAAKAKKSDLLECYRKDLESYDDLEGEVTFELVLSGNAKIIGIRPTLSTLDNEDVEQCMVEAMMGVSVAGHVTARLVLSSVTVKLSRGPEKNGKRVGQIRFE
jgi:hypothetical protein